MATVNIRGKEAEAYSANFSYPELVFLVHDWDPQEREHKTEDLNLKWNCSRAIELLKCLYVQIDREVEQGITEQFQLSVSAIDSFFGV